MNDVKRTTELGKWLRKLRIDRDEKLQDMAEAIGKTSSFVSAIEFGKKQAPAGFVEAIISTYRLDDDDAEDLRRAADRSRAAFVLEPRDVLGRDTAGLLARKIDTLSEHQLLDIQRILTGNKKG